MEEIEKTLVTFRMTTLWGIILMLNLDLILWLVLSTNLLLKLSKMPEKLWFLRVLMTQNLSNTVIISTICLFQDKLGKDKTMLLLQVFITILFNKENQSILAMKINLSNKS
jgi:hypothetical protein